MQRLPQIAIALAAIAVVMVALAIYVVSTRDGDAPRTTPESTHDAIPDAAVPRPTVPIDATFEDAPVDDAATGAACAPCNDQCSLRCTCKDGATTSSFHCTNGCCIRPADRCVEDCRHHGGVR